MNIIRWHSCVCDNYANGRASRESSPIAHSVIVRDKQHFVNKAVQYIPAFDCPRWFVDSMLFHTFANQRSGACVHCMYLYFWCLPDKKEQIWEWQVFKEGYYKIFLKLLVKLLITPNCMVVQHTYHMYSYCSCKYVPSFLWFLQSVCHTTCEWILWYWCKYCIVGRGLCILSSYF